MKNLLQTLQNLTPQEKKRHALGLAAVFVIFTLLFLWAGYVFLPPATQKARRKIVNDDYAVLTQPMTADSSLDQVIFVKDRLYGVVLNVRTFGRVPQGSVHITVYDNAGQVAAVADQDMSQLLDDTFHWFFFDQRLDVPFGGDYYRLHITVDPETPQDVIAFWRSDGPAQDFVEEEGMQPEFPMESWLLWENNQELDATLALQYIENASGPFIIGAFSFFAAFVLVLLLFLYLLVFVWKAPVHRIFAAAALGLGFVFAFLIPPRAAPDEYTHIATAYHYSNRILGTDHLDNNGTLGVRPGDVMMLQNYDPRAIDVYAWGDMAENLFTRAPQGEMVRVSANIVQGGFTPLHALPTLGILLARLLGLSKTGLLLLGRFANLLFFTWVISRAIRRMPLAKPTLALIALLPMSLQLAASFSYDAYVIALSFYFIAYCLDITLEKKPVGPRQIALLLVLSLLIAPAKTIYLLLLPFIFIIPAQLYQSKKVALLSRVVTFGTALVLWVVFSMNSLLLSAGHTPAAPATQSPALSAQAHLLPRATGVQLSIAAGPSTGLYVSAHSPLREPVGQYTLKPNGDADQNFTLRHIVTHLPATVKILVRSFWEQGPLWLQGVLGGRLGEIIAVDIEINWLFIIGLLGILLASALPQPGDSLRLSQRQKWFSLAVFAGVGAALLLACLTWTPINYKTLFGVQGRYFLPVLPLALLYLRRDNLTFSRPVWRHLMYAALVLVVLCQLDAFIIILQR